MAASFPDAWEEVAFVTISKFDATDITLECAAMTETIDISQGDYPGESIPNLAGGRIWKQSPEEDGEITLEFYPTDASLATGEDNLGLFQAFAGGDWSTTEPITSDTSWAVGVDRTRDRFRICICWTDDPACTSAMDAIDTDDTVALRFTALSCRMISHKASFTDGILKVTATFKYPAMNQAGDTKMWRWESTADAGATSPGTNLLVIGTYSDEDSYSAA